LKAILTEHTVLKEKYQTEGKATAQAYDSAVHRINKLQHELETKRTAGVLRRAFMRAEQSIEVDVRKAEADRSHHAREAARLGDLFKASTARSGQLEEQVTVVMHELASHDRSRLLQQKGAFDAERQPFLDELAKLNKALSDIEASVIREAAVIGATVTKSYLSAKELPTFDAVIVDEASMVLLPALYYAAGLAGERVVVCGDFRQLPPIVPTEQQAILKEIGSDVFHAAGIVTVFENRARDRRLVMLDEQYRMDDEICSLISGPMYGGKLRTSQKRSSSEAGREIDLLSKTLTIVDTSQLWPFETQTPFGSRYNLLHALVVRNLFSHLNKAGLLRDRSLGICTPYAAQAKLIKRLVEDEGLKEVIEAGTVHRYQGDEKSMMIIDVPESVGGGRYVGHFLQGDHPDDAGAKLFNVAVSRAQEHLVFVANLTYLDGRLPGGAMLRDFLFQAQMRGRVIDARDVLTLQSVDLRGLTRPIDIDLGEQRTGLFGQKDFDAVFLADVEQAKRSIVIFSGFVTSDRVASYGDLFRRKIMDGVTVRCVTRPPQYNGSMAPELGKEALDALEAIGVIVDCRRDIHQKIVLVDSSVVWFGSLNPLSHTARTDETMLRTKSPHFADELARQVAVRPTRREEASELAPVMAENPRCGECGGRTFYVKSRQGNRLFICEAEDGWMQDVDRAAAGPAPGSRNLPELGPACPKCEAETRRRYGRYGPFFTCVRYPACDGKFNTRQAAERMKGNRRAGGGDA
jgi:hypothetical protein